MVKTKQEAPPKRRNLRLRTRKLSRTQKKQLAKSKKIPRAWRILLSSFKTFKDNWRLIGGIALVYGFLSVLLAQGNTAVSDFALEESSGAFEEATNEFSSYINGFGASDSLMQMLLSTALTLAVILALRRLKAGEEISVKDAYYLSMAPLVPFFILLALLFVQLIPMLLASGGLQFALGSGVSASPFEVVIWLVVFVLASTWSFYMLSRTYIALFIVTLPGMTPLQAWRKAKELVLGRRLAISLKLIFMPLAMILILAAIMIPAILVLPAFAGPLFIVLSPLVTTLAIIYLFNLYQETIK